MNNKPKLQESELKLKRLFQSYYINEDLEIPDLLRSREIGFIPFDGSMVRHREFHGRQDLKRFLIDVTPRHLYHSVAYYDFPTKRSMQEKNWKGAELIFDLDADHIEGASKMTYEQILEEVKKHTLRLINRFLIDLMGIPGENIKLFFSGGRGYHVHVQADKIYPLDSNARREISNLVRGEGVTLENLKQVNEGSKQPLKGWFEIADSEVTDLFSGILDGTKSDVLRQIFKKEEILQNYMDSLEKSVRFPSETIKKIDLFSRAGIEKYKIMSERDFRVADFVAKSKIDSMKCEIDEPVTTDLHRLIRFPGSLHGKTGLAVTKIPINMLEAFDPLIEAIPKTFLEGQDEITLTRPLKIKMGGHEYDLSGNCKVPRYLGIFAVAGRFANYV